MIKPVDDELYPMLCEWWKAHGWPEVPIGMLGQRGYIAFVEDKPIIAGFLLKDENSYFGMLEYVVANPEATQDEKSRGIAELIQSISKTAHDIEMRSMMTISDNPHLIQKYLDNGFKITSKSVTVLVKEV